MVTKTANTLIFPNTYIDKLQQDTTNSHAYYINICPE